MFAHFVVLSLLYLLTVSITLSEQAPRDQSRLTIVLVAPRNSPAGLPTSAARGVRLGAEEAKQTARLFGAEIELLEASARPNAVAAATEMLSRQQAQVLIGTFPDDADELSRLAESRRILFFNIASRSQSLRTACRRLTFHIEATDAMYANGARWRAGAVAPTKGGAPAPFDSVVLWDSTLQRYGASQINDRYSARFGVGMDGSAWAGWVAVKIVAEAALRARSSEPSRLLAYLESPGTQFDGHKGWPLTFRTAEHQLRQPLYVVGVQGRVPSSARLVRDVPELRALLPASERSNESAPPNQVLDRLITSPTAARCSWARGR